MCCSIIGSCTSWLNMRVVGYRGLCSGAWRVVVLLVSKFQTSRLLVFSEDLFFLYLLSPFIFNAGYAPSLSLYVCVWIVSSCSELDYIWIGFLVVWNLEKGFLYFGTVFLWIGFGVRNQNFLLQYLYRRDQTVSNVELNINPPIPISILVPS